MSDTHQPTPNLEDLANLNNGPGRITVILENPVQDGVTWLVQMSIPALNMTCELTVGGSDVESAMQEAEQWVAMHVDELKQLAQNSRVN